MRARGESLLASKPDDDWASEVPRVFETIQIKTELKTSEGRRVFYKLPLDLTNLRRSSPPVVR